ncbi:hypothetical protein K8Z61_18505 [Nocardioides sp. TRM66260-LWL]|uniref:hypothetical protein n=1 Tax=Nocardioides sp. TRM66260-LWL TaxID=2874478 RepID=UPI001CC7A3F2|nr:hypothetical protein [Nocardioides sp. TRM66260-LWL]MBZ5736487.1 hypothetical protein [Nocardioides sp. TRM66260-LWL]
MPKSIVSPDDSNKTTVKDLIGSPMMIPARVLSVLQLAFLSGALLRNAGPNANGLVSYEESTPLFLDGDPELVGEFAEIPVRAGQKGLPRIAQSTPQGLGVRVSKRMRDMNAIGEVNRQITQLTNTMIRADERALRQLFNNPAIPTIAAGAAWDTSNGRPHKDIANAQEVVASAKPAGTTDADANFGFEADTIVMPGSIIPILIGNDSFAAVYNRDQLVAEDIRYTGKLPQKVLGLDGLKSRTFASDRVLVVERGTVGFYSDFQPLEVTELYPEGNGPNGGPTQSWRSDATRERVSGVDQPLAACWITGIRS